MRSVGNLALALLLVAAAARLSAQPAPPKPGPEHEALKHYEGVWDAVVKSPAGETKGTMTWKMDLGGLWLMETFKGEFDGTAFEGRAAMSYDPAKKKYVHVWIDSMSTSPMISEGAFDKEKKTMTLVGDMTMPDGKSMKATMRTQVIDADNLVFTMNAAGPDGKDFEMMKISYKRRR